MGCRVRFLLAPRRSGLTRDPRKGILLETPTPGGSGGFSYLRVALGFVAELLRVLGELFPRLFGDGLEVLLVLRGLNDADTKPRDDAFVADVVLRHGGTTLVAFEPERLAKEEKLLRIGALRGHQ